MSERFSIGKIIVTVLTVLALLWLKWIIIPASTLAFAGNFFFWGIFVSCILACIALFIGEDNYDGFNYAGIVLLIGIGITLLILMIGGIAGSALFKSTQKYEQLGDITVKEYTEEISPLDMSQVPYIDEAVAKKLGDKKLGEDPSLGSQVDLGEFVEQEVNGKLVLVAPLEHVDYFKYKANSEGTPGYVVVSATNPQDVKLVREIDGKAIKIKYQPKAHYKERLKRHIRNSGFKSEGLTDYSFELDDAGYPYWVVTMFKNTTAFGTSEATGVVVVDATSGDIEKYSINEAPDWIDIIQPKSFVSTQIANYGGFVHGVFNWSNKDKIKATQGMSTIYNNGNCYYYTGLTSYGSDDATIGFLLVNTRTKEVVKYTMSGAHENAAMRSAEGKVQNLGYDATFPLPVNLDGIPTYFMTLKDTEGLIKMFAFVNINDYSTVGVGDSIMQAKKAYTSAYLSNGNEVAFSDEAFMYDIEGIIQRIAFKVEDGNTYYTFTIQDSDIIFVAPSTVSEELTITEKGDIIKLEYVDEKNLNVTVTGFDNKMINTRRSEDQVQKQEDIESAEKPNSKVTTVDTENINNEWDSLTDEEKAKLLESQKEEK